MGKIIETKVDAFHLGMVDDIRSKRVGVCQLCKGFDALSYKHKLVPYRSSESGNDTISRKISMFVYANGRLYGAGSPTAAGATFYYKDTFTDGTWSTTANNVTSIGVGDTLISNSFCIYYAKTGLIYVPTGGSSVSAYDPTGSAAWATHSLGLFDKGTTALVHSKDDILYVSYYHSTAGARIGKYDGTTWTDIALTIGNRWVITSMCEYGNYLAIGCKPLSTTGLGATSKVFLWDRDSSVTTLAESIDWGLGDLQILEELEGQLIGISSKTDTTLLFGSTHSFKYYAGASGAIEFAQFKGFGFSYYTFLGQIRQKVNNRIYFPASYARTDGATGLAGIWSVGRNSPGEPFAVNIEYLPNNDTPITTIDGFFLIGDYMFIAYSDSGGTLDGYISKTDNSSTAYTASATYETIKYDAGDISQKKKLIGFTAMTTPMPTAGQVVVKYRKDAETSWTTIMTSTEDSSLSKSAVNIESTGANLPSDYKEIQFQILSTGGAEPIGYSFMEEIEGKRLYMALWEAVMSFGASLIRK